MILPKSLSLRALSRPARSIRPRISQPRLKQQYSSAPDPPKSSNTVPWALSAIVATAIGTYVVLQPSSKGGSTHHKTEASDDGKEKSTADHLHDKFDAKKEAAKRDMELAKSMLPKKERDGDSVKNHSIAAEKNEKKVRQGKFCEEEFDNHVQEHTDDPGKDFEKIKREAKK